MVQDKYKIYGTDRFIPSRHLLDFDAAFYSLTYKNLQDEDDNYFVNLSSYSKRLELKRNLENLGNLNQRIFKTSKHQMNSSSANNETANNKSEDQIWPCVPRKKPCLVNERIFDLPNFNSAFHLTQTIDWGQNDVIVTSVKNRIITGRGVSEKHTTTEVLTEYEGDIGTAVAWSGNGVYLAIGTKNGLLQVWNMIKKKLIVEEKCCRLNCTVTSIQWHPMHHSLAWACSRGKISKGDFRKTITITVEFAHDGCICKLKYSPRANYLCSSGLDGYVRVWRGDSCEPYMEIEMSNPVNALAWHPWRTGLLAVGESYPISEHRTSRNSNYGSLSIWNVNKAKMEYMGKPSEPIDIKCLEFSKLSGEMVYSQWLKGESEQNHCDIVVLGKADQLLDISQQGRGCVTSLMWSPDGTKLGAAGTSETLKIFKFHQSRDQFNKRRKRSYDVMCFNECHTTIR